jgi:short-chain fatty acids transporter
MATPSVNPNSGKGVVSSSSKPRTFLSTITSFFLFLFERITPDPYIFAIALTILTALLAGVFAPKGTTETILTGWYNGLFSILAFAFQMVLVLVTGYALSNSPPVRRLLDRLAGIATTPKRAVVVLVLVVAGLLAREIAKRIRTDFGWLVAAAYSGWIIWASGLSSSIALAQATPGSALNVVQKLTGQVLTLNETILAPFNVVPVLVLVILIPILYCAIQPTEEETLAADSARLIAEDQARAGRSDEAPTLARHLERAWILNLIVVIAGVAALAIIWLKSGFNLDINSVIFLFFIAGLLLHWRPIAYVEAINNAARVTGPLILQYPLYGGIMGIMTTTGLAEVISKAFVAFSNVHTLPFWNFIASIIISLFIPSGGGHWAVQGPFAVPAAAQLHTSQAATAMAVAMGEQVANMIQPFWALPVLAIAGISLRRVMGFTVMSFFLGAIVFGLALLVLV